MKTVVGAALEPIDQQAALVHNQGVFSIEQAHILNGVLPGIGQWFVGGDITHLDVASEILNAVGHAETLASAIFVTHLRAPAAEPTHLWLGNLDPASYSGATD